MIEVEIRARIEDVEKIKNELKNIGAKFIKVEKQIDRIFGHPMFLDEDKMITEGGLSVRIREVGDKKTLEFKEILRTGGGIEIKSELSSVDVGLKFLNKLEFKEAFTISKSREIYSYKNFTVCLDKVDRIGEFIEIEKMVEIFENVNKAREECVKLLKILFPNFQIENRKYGDLMQEILNKDN